MSTKTEHEPDAQPKSGKSGEDGRDTEEMKELVGTALDWSDKQKRILTAHGKADDYYTTERGFPFTEDELPHHHLQKSRASNSSDTAEDVRGHGLGVLDSIVERPALALVRELEVQKHDARGTHDDE